jgi:polysaccharide deacetylase family protein (PEP-CTERM system associated)
LILTGLICIFAIQGPGSTSQFINCMNVLTIDLEDWFHILGNKSTALPEQWKKFPSRLHENNDRLLDMLEKHNTKATFFVLGWIAERYPEVVKKIHAAGHEIGAHSYGHQLLFNQTPEEMRADMLYSIKLLEDLIGNKITLYRAPGFSLTHKTSYAWEILAECGITTEASVFPAKRIHGGINDFSYAVPCRLRINGTEIKEFPVSTQKIFGKRFVFSGGGYFRFFSYYFIKKWMKDKSYVMSYFHPRDFDSGQPMIEDLAWYRKFMSYTGLKSSEKKFERLLSDFTFINISAASGMINWETTPVVDLKPVLHLRTPAPKPVKAEVTESFLVTSRPK